MSTHNGCGCTSEDCRVNGCLMKRQRNEAGGFYAADSADCGCSTEDKTDAERYRWLRNSAGFLALPYIDHGGGPEFPSGSELDAAIDHARRAEGCVE